MATESRNAQKEIKGALDALVKFRDEVSTVVERHSDEVLDRMSEAGKALGWPADFVDATREQLRQTAHLQIRFLDELSSTWERQLEHSSSAPPTVPSAPGVGGAKTPLEMWMDATQLWQRNWQQAFSTMTGVGGVDERERTKRHSDR